jgi:hypothetical protein
MTVYTVAIARITSSGAFRYSEIQTTDAASMIENLSNIGQVAWVVATEIAQ